MSWIEEKVNKLKELWGKGKTASQIAEILGGLSRNAVIGKAHRLNLSAKIRPKNFNQETNNNKRDKLPGIMNFKEILSSTIRGAEGGSSASR